MVQETTHKRLYPGTLVRINRTLEYGIIIRVKINWGPLFDNPFCYDVLVKGRQVSAYGEGITVIGET